MPLNITLGSTSVRGFGFTTEDFFSFTATIASNTTSYNLRTAALAAGWTGTSKLKAVINVNSGVRLNGTGNTTSSALILTSIPAKSIITLNNNGTIYGAGGTGGTSLWKAGVAGNTSPAAIGQGGSNAPDGWGSGMPNGSTGQYGSGSSGFTAIYLDSNVVFNIYNYGIITGGGGGSGGMGVNNDGGGNGGNGGIALVETTTPTVTLYNQSGGVFGGGGGGGSGWGNRASGATTGGTTGTDAYISVNGGGNFGTIGSAGSSSTNNSTKLFNTAGTYSL